MSVAAVCGLPRIVRIRGDRITGGREESVKRRRQRRFLPVLAGACIVLFLAGCGDNESVHTGTEAQGAQIQESETQTEPETESKSDKSMPEKADGTREAGETDTMAVPTEGAADAAEDVTKPTGAAESMGATEDTEGTQPQSGPWNKDSREQVEIDEETRRELTEELLEEENMDTSVMEEGRSTTGCSFDIPEGFAESEEVANLYVRKRYPIDASTIYYAVMEEDIALQLLTKEAFAEQMEADLQAAYHEETKVVVDSFEHVEVSGYPAFRILCHYTVGGVEITQLQYAINADRSYMITYSQTSDYDYMELYEASAATIEVK